MRHDSAPGEGLFAWSLKHPSIALLLAMVITAVAVLGITQLRIQTNFVDLLPEHQPSVIELKRLEKVVGGASFVVLTVETKDPTLAPPFLEALAAQLQHHPDVRFIDYRPPVAFFRRAALMYLSIEELTSFAKRMERRIDQLKLGEIYIDLERADEKLSLHDFESTYPFIREHEYYRNDAGTLFVMLIKPRGRATDLGFSKAFLRDIRGAVESIRTSDDLHVQLTGPYVKALTQIENVTRDVRRVGLLALLGMTLILSIYFRRKRAVIIIGVPVLAGVVWAMGLAYIFFGTLNFFTALSCAVMLGLSADYGIHFFSHYVQRRADGTAVHQALCLTYRELIRPMCVAAATTAAAFLALALSDFKPLHQFGIIAGCGMFCTITTIFLLFPSVTLLFEKYSPLSTTPRQTTVATGWTVRLFQCTTGAKGRRWGMIILGLLLLPLAFGLPHFDYNVNSILGTQATRGLDSRVDQIFNYSINPEIARATSPEDAARFAEAIRQTREQFTHTPTGSRIQTAIAMSDFIPKQQTEKMAIIRELAKQFTPTVVRRMPEEERAVYERLRPALTPTPIQFRDLPAELVTKYQDLQGNVGHFLYIFPAYDRMSGHQLRQFIAEMQSVHCADCDAAVVVSGESIIFHEIVERLLQEGRWVIVASLVAILLALLLIFRSGWHAFRCFLPLFVGLLVTLSITRLFDIQFNLVSLAAIPVLMGSGIDYAIYLYQQVHQHEDGSILAALHVSASPIIASAATTMCGFGSLLIADNGGAQSFGLITTLGIGTCALITLCWFPGRLAWWTIFTGRRRGDEVGRQLEARG